MQGRLPVTLPAVPGVSHIELFLCVCHVHSNLFIMRLAVLTPPVPYVQVFVRLLMRGHQCPQSSLPSVVPISSVTRPTHLATALPLMPLRNTVACNGRALASPPPSLLPVQGRLSQLAWVGPCVNREGTPRLPFMVTVQWAVP